MKKLRNFRKEQKTESDVNEPDSVLAYLDSLTFKPLNERDFEAFRKYDLFLDDLKIRKMIKEQERRIRIQKYWGITFGYYFIRTEFQFWRRCDDGIAPLLLEFYKQMGEKLDDIRENYPDEDVDGFWFQINYSNHIRSYIKASRELSEKKQYKTSPASDI